MPAFQPFSLLTNISTEGNHAWDFLPFGRKDGVFTYVDTALDQVDLRPTVTLSFTAPSKTSKLMKCRIKITKPVSRDDTVSGLTKFDHNVTADCTFIAPQHSAEFDRETVIALMREALTSTTNSPVPGTFKEGTPVY